MRIEQITAETSSASLVVYSDDESLYDYLFEFEVRDGVYPMEDRDVNWFNTTWFKINFRKPPCEVTQGEIDLVASGISLSLNATRGLTINVKSVSDIVEIA